MSQLQLVCQVCWRPIEFGHLGIDTAVIAEYQAAEAARRATETSGELLEDLIEEPPAPTWATHCEDCEPNTCGYCIQASELRSYKDLVRWTGHLMGKTWLAASDWNHLLEQVAADQDSRFREVPS